MGKIIYISERIANKKPLNEGFLIDELPDDINSALRDNKTSFGNNPAFPDLEDDSFIETIANSRFNEVRRELKKIGKVEDSDINTPEGLLSKLLLQCQEEESNIREQLEKICYNHVIKMFNVPEGIIDLEVNLNNDITLKGNAFNVDRVKGSYEFDDYTSAEQLKAEVYKRRIINALNMGAGLEYSSNIKEYIGEIFELNPKLPQLYRDIILLNNYLIYTKEDWNITDKDAKQLGCVLLKLGNDTKKTKIVSQGKIFPVLLSETIRGFMQLFSSHGLPNDFSLASEIIKRSDYVKAEPWEMRIGPELWKLLKKSCHFTTNELPYLYRKICSLNIDSFNEYFKNVFAETNKGKRMSSIIIDSIKEDMPDSDDIDTMKTADVDKSIISDEYMHEDEL